MNGIRTDQAVALAAGLDLLPASRVPEPDVVLPRLKEKYDFHVVAIFLPHVESQLRVRGEGRRDVAARAWNAMWDVLLLGAIHNVPAMCSLQSTTTLERFTAKSRISVTNYAFQALPRLSGLYQLTDRDRQWLEANFAAARELLEDHRFQTAVHCLATFRWHTIPRARLALIWAGIESLFGVDSEIAFRVSLYVARFLAPGDAPEQQRLFQLMRKLYNLRSQAVHGAKLKGDPRVAVTDSAQILQQLVVKCVEVRALPSTSQLAP